MCDHVPTVPIRFDVPIPPGDYPRRDILYGCPGKVQRAIVTSRVISSCMTHWADGRTRPCYAPVAPCPGCAKGKPRLWKAFLAGLDFLTKKEVVLMLTPWGVRPWKGRLTGSGPGVRGYVLTLAAPGLEGPRRLQVSISDTPVTGPLPEPYDVEAHMMHVWAVEAAKADPDGDERWEMIPVPGV